MDETKSLNEMTTWLPIAISLGALALSLISLAWNFILERKKGKAKLQVWQRNSFYLGGEDDRTKINLVIRNLSPRPTAVIDIHVRNDDGTVIKNLSANDVVDLPLKIEPWDVQIISFRVEKHEESSISNIMLSDIDDNKIVVTRGNGKKWHG